MKNNRSILKKTSNFFYVLSAALMIAAMVVNVIPPKPAMAAVGAIWTTKTTCVTPDPQDENHYGIGESIYLRGDNFAPNTAFSFTIEKANQPHKGTILATGSGTTDGSGYFCIFAHTVVVTDYTGEYTTDVLISGVNNSKNDNFQIDPPATPTPSNTPVPPTPTNTEVPPTPTNTEVPPTPTDTEVPPTPTDTEVPPTPTDTTEPPTATTPPENTPTNPPENTPTNPPPPPQITEQVLIPVTGADIHGGQFASSRLFLASIVSLGVGMVLSGMARKEEE